MAQYELAKYTQQPHTTRVATMRELLPTYQQQLGELLPKHLNTDRFLRLALTALGNNPDLSECTPASIVGSLMESAAMGLEPNVLGQSYLVPFWHRSKKKGVPDKRICTLIPGYRGLVQLGWASNQIASIRAVVHRVGDAFEYRPAADHPIMHVPGEKTKYGEVMGAYALIWTRFGGPPMCDYMDRDDLERIRRTAKTGKVWTQHYEEQCKKTVLRRIFKIAPISIMAQRAADLDEQAEVGAQDLGQDVDVPEVVGRPTFWQRLFTRRRGPEVEAMASPVMEPEVMDGDDAHDSREG